MPDDRDILTLLQAQIREAEERVREAADREALAAHDRAEAENDVRALRPALAVLLRRLDGGVDSEVTTEGVPAGDAPVDTKSAPPIAGVDEGPVVADGRLAGIATYRGRPRLPAVLQRILSEGGRWSQHAVIEHVNSLEPFASDPVGRTSIINRLNELAANVESPVVKHNDNTYELVRESNAPTDQPLGQLEGIVP